MVAGALGNTTFTNITANDNGLVGAVAGAIGDASLTSVMTEGNDGLGAAAIALGDASLNGVIANENDLLGAAALAFGDASLIDVTANGNGFVGVVAVSLGGVPILDLLLGEGGLLEGVVGPASIPYVDFAEIDLEEAMETPGDSMLYGVTANGNGLIGGLAVAGGDVSVSDSSFNENGLLGLGAASLFDGDVTVFRITALGNDGIGVAMGSASLPFAVTTLRLAPEAYVGPSLTAEVLLACSTVTGNANEGLAAGSDMTIAGNDLSGNGGGPYQAYFGATVAEDSSVDCAGFENALSDYMAKRHAYVHSLLKRAAAT